MPVCHTCGRYYTKHAMLCPACFPPAPKHIQSTFAVPAVGDVYRDPTRGDAQKIIAVRFTAATELALELADGSIVEIDLEALKPVP